MPLSPAASSLATPRVPLKRSGLSACDLRVICFASPQRNRMQLFPDDDLKFDTFNKDIVSNRIPSCANPLIFCLSQFEKCGYIEKAQRFLGDN
jgi:hypothetical protein